MAGESARVVAESRRRRGEALVRSAEAFERGADGEAATFAALAALPPSYVVLHDRRWPGRQRANLDHVVIGPTGVAVVDAKNWQGRVGVVDGVLRQNGRDRSRAVVGTREAATAVADVLPLGAGGVRVRAVVCLVAEEPVRDVVDGVVVCTLPLLTSELQDAPEVLAEAEVRSIAAALDRALPAATSPTPAVPAPLRTRRRSTRSRTLRRTSPGRSLAAMVVAVLLATFVMLQLDSVAERSAGLLDSAMTREASYGETLTVKGYREQRPVLEVAVSRPTRVMSPDAATRPGPGFTLMASTVTVRNGGQRAWVSGTDLEFRLIGAKGEIRRINHWVTRVSTGRALPPEVTLRPGERIRGQLVFEVARGTRPESVELHAGPSVPVVYQWADDHGG